MFEIGFTELVVIAIVAVLVLGPEQLPRLMYRFGKWWKQLSYTRFALEKQFEAFMDKEDARERTLIEHRPDQPSDGTP